jgi:hypothetical protein
MMEVSTSSPRVVPAHDATSALTRRFERWRMVSLVVVLSVVAGPAVAPAQEYVRLDGIVDWVSGNTLMLRVDPPPVPPVYVISGAYLVPVAPLVQAIKVDVSGLRQSEYSFMQASERVAVIGVFDGDRQVLIATSLIRGPALQMP